MRQQHLRRGANQARQCASHPDRRATYCETFITSEPSADVAAQFAVHGQQASEQAASLGVEAQKLMRQFARWDEAFSPGELREMRGILARGEPLSDMLQAKTYLLAGEWGRRQLGPLLPRVARTEAQFIDTLAFRYGAMVVAFYLTWRDAPRTYPSNPGKVLNHFMDLKIGAQATYFDDLLTNDALLRTAFQVCMGLITALGGYRHCGRYTPIDGFDRPISFLEGGEGTG